MTKAILYLEDGTKFFGEALSVHAETAGEVVFNTSMSGYQEILTDPSYAGQMVCMTYPLIGNYGVNDEDIESNKNLNHTYLPNSSKTLLFLQSLFHNVHLLILLPLHCDSEKQSTQTPLVSA